LPCVTFPGGCLGAPLRICPKRCPRDWRLRMKPSAPGFHSARLADPKARTCWCGHGGRRSPASCSTSAPTSRGRWDGWWTGAEASGRGATPRSRCWTMRRWWAGCATCWPMESRRGWWTSAPSGRAFRVCRSCWGQRGGCSGGSTGRSAGEGVKGLVSTPRLDTSSPTNRLTPFLGHVARPSWPTTYRPQQASHPAYTPSRRMRRASAMDRCQPAAMSPTSRHPPQRVDEP
jgi:hypothetical protein